MPLSNKKRKYIERFATRKRPEAMANELNLPLDLVKMEIEKITGRPVREREPAMEKLCWFLLLAMALFVPVPIFQRTFDYANFPKTIFLQLGSLLLLASWLLHCRLEKSITIYKCPLYLPLGIGFAWAGLVTLWANYSYLSLVQWIHWTACGLIFFIALQLLNQPKRGQQLMACLLISGFLVSVMGIAQHLFGLDWVHQNAPPAATFANRNMATHYIVGTLPAVLALLGAARSKTITWLCAGVFAVMLVFIYFTVTRAAWVAVICQLFFLSGYFVWDRMRRKSVHRLDLSKVAAIGAAMGATLLVVYLAELNIQQDVEGKKEKVSAETDAAPTKQGLGRLSRDDSVKYRLIYWQNTLKMIRDHPFSGIGIQNFRVQYPYYHEAQKEDNELKLFKAPRYAHNDFLQIVAELGIPGLAILLWTGFLLMKMGFRLLFKQEEGTNRLMGINSLAAILGICLLACFSSPIYRATPPFLLALHIAILARLAIGPGPGPSHARNAVFWKFKNTRLALGGAVVSLLLAFAWGVLQNRWVKADGFYEYQRYFIDQNDWKNVIRFGKKVRQYNPYRADTLNSSGAALLKSNKNQEAREILELYTKRYPHSSSALFYLGQVYENLGDFDKAEATLSHAAEIVPFEGWVHRILGRVLISKGKKEEALEEYRLATSATPGIRSFHFYHGRLASEFELFEEAAEQFRKAVEADENWGNAQKFLGLTLFNELDQKEEGVEHLKKALQLNPKIRQAKMILSLIEQFEAPALPESETSPR